MTCEWPLATEHLPPEWETTPPLTKTRALTLASRTLERLCGGRVGVCPVTIQPGRRQCTTHAYASTLRMAGYGSSFGPVNWNGVWSNVACGCPTSTCELQLPDPIGRIDEVKADGVVIDPSNYQVADDTYLIWVGSDPCPFGAPEKMLVTYVNAYPPGEVGAMAATILAVEFAAAITGAQCRLPPGVQTISRQGITMEIPTGAFPGGRTGISEVDAFIATWNPNNIQPGSFWSPDLPQNRRIGG